MLSEPSRGLFLSSARVFPTLREAPTGDSFGEWRSDAIEIELCDVAKPWSLVELCDVARLMDVCEATSAPALGSGLLPRGAERRLDGGLVTVTRGLAIISASIAPSTATMLRVLLRSELPSEWSALPFAVLKNPSVALI